MGPTCRGPGGVGSLPESGGCQSDSPAVGPQSTRGRSLPQSMQ